MGRALTELGYKVCGAVGLKANNMEERIREIAFSVVPEYDAFQDNPWPILFRELDQEWPGSRFILTLREENSWIRSVVRHFGSTPHQMQRWIYGVDFPAGNENIFLNRYRQHNDDVLEYFKDRQSDLLIVEIGAEDPWKDVCMFLSAEIPDCPFPHSNKGGSGWKSVRWLKNFKKRIARRGARFGRPSR